MRISKLLVSAILLGFVFPASAQWVDSQTPSNAAPVGAYGRWSLAFSDEFNTNVLDTSKWGIDVSSSSRAARANQGIDSWYWKAANVEMDGSNVVLHVTKEDATTMYCGSISSDGLYEPTYGYIEARVQIADTHKSTHTAFWFQGDNMGNVDGTGNDGAEIDVFESAWFADSTKAVVHIDGYGVDKQANTKPYSTPGLHDGYHIFGMEWTHDYLKLYYDGVLKVTYTGIWVPWVNEYIWLSDGASFGDVGTFASEPIGWLTSAKFDYVRVWEQVPSTNAPVFTSDPISKADATEDVAYSGTLTNNASDGDNDPLTYSKTTGPGWLTVSSDGSLTGTPAGTDTGTNSWTVQVADDTNGNDTATLKIIVIATNDYPIFGQDPIDRPYAVKDILYTNTVAGEATDEEDDPLTYSRASGPAWLNIAGDGALSGIPTVSDVGTNTWSVQVSDGNGGTDTATLRIWVKDETNMAPVVNAGNDQTVLFAGESLWTPAQIAVAAWYDAADAGTITESGGFVSQWNDKSGNGRHMVQEIGDDQPGYTATAWDGALPALTFDGANDYLEHATQQTESVVTMAVVLEQVNTDSGDRAFGVRGAAGTKDNFAFASDNSLRYDGDKSDANMVTVAVGKHFRVATRTTSSQSDYCDGSTNIIDNAVLPDVDGYINAGNTMANLSGYFGSKIAEGIIITNTITDDTRQKIEGYLAHKWGLETALPATHTYKASAPQATAAIATLNPTVTDPNGDSMTVLWTVTSGPAGTVFDDANAATTTVIFANTGTYTLRLTVDDGLAQTYDEVTVIVGNDTDSDGLMDSWELTYFDDLTNSAGQADEDQDDDGFIDLHEYLAGTDPTNNASRLVVTDGQQGAATNEFVLTWQAISNKTYMILSKSALTNATWTTNDTGITGVEPLCAHTVTTTEARSYYLLKLEN